jgi:NADPH-dependent curcumin reductase CurA
MSRNGEPVYSCFFQQSSFANFALAPAKDVVKIRRDAPIEMLGPLGCGLQTGAAAVLNVMQPAAGQSIAVYGVGGVGLAGLMAARNAGCIRSSPSIGSPAGWRSPANSVPRIRSKAAAPRCSPKSARSPAAAPISH